VTPSPWQSPPRRGVFPDPLQQGVRADVVAEVGPLEVHVARTARCPVRCTTCYADAGPEGADADIASLEADLDQLAAAGVFEIAIGGGDGPPDAALFALVRGARARGMVPNLTTSGFGFGREAARALRPWVGQVNVSLDGLDTYAAVRGWRGAGLALAAIEALVAEGVRVGVNTVWTRDNLPELERIGRELAARGVAEWQWLRLKPAGRGREVYARQVPSPEEMLSLWPRALAVEAETGLVLRWDCAMVPFLAAHGLPVEAARQLAVEGCPGGRSLLARGADGRWAPCSFASDVAEEGPFEEVWRRGSAVSAWREAAPEPCRGCEWRDVCRGGCRVVAAHTSGDPLAADPECPRVAAWRS
jgi:radical SAM protein with 4Fe4S-binding SPASM domain